jgi:hypothetical protein
MNPKRVKDLIIGGVLHAQHDHEYREDNPTLTPWPVRVKFISRNELNIREAKRLRNWLTEVIESEEAFEALKVTT